MAVQEISWCVYAFHKTGAGSRLRPLRRVGKAVWWPFSEASGCLLCEDGSGADVDREKRACREGATEREHPSPPLPPHPFLSALPLGGLAVLMPLPQSPDSRTTVSARAMVWEFIGEREGACSRRGSLCGELSPSILLGLSPKQDRLAHSPGPFLSLSL